MIRLGQVRQLSNSQISFDKQILDEVQRRTGHDLKTIEYVNKGIKNHLEHLVKKTDAISIILPNIGILHLKYNYFKRLLALSYKYKKNFPNSYNKERLKVLQLKSDKFKKYFQSMEDLKKPVYSSRHLQKNRLKSKYYTAGQKLNRIIELQNNLNK